MSSRIKQSFGSIHINEGNTLTLSEGKYVVDYSRKFYLFDIVPMGAIRMSSSDRWKTNPNHRDPKRRQRPIVAQYFQYRDSLRDQAHKINFQLNQFLDIVFFIPMPDSWSEKKKDRMNGLPCKVRPDVDNLCKAIMDCFRKEDGDIWTIKAQKHYASKGSILIYA